MSFEVDMTRTLNAPPSLVYQAWGDPKIMRKWFCPTPGGCRLADTTYIEGGYYMILMVADEKVYPHHGKYQKLTVGETIQFSWNTNVVDDTLVTITLKEVPDGTELRLVHTGFPNADICDQHRQGWTACLENLGLTVDSDIK